MTTINHSTTAAQNVFDMINQAQVFMDNSIDLIIIQNTPWFRAKDIACILGYKNTIHAIREHVKDKNKEPLKTLATRGRKTRPLTFNEENSIYINEAGLYQLIMKSKLKVAEAFQDWVTDDLLPSIRKVGQNKYIQDLETKLAQVERERLALNDYVRNIELLKKDQFFYLATTRAYAARNRFEFGGVKQAKNLKARFSSYNTGRAEGDLMYVTKIFKCNKYELIEDRLHAILKQFKDKPDSRKEMVHLRYDLLVEVVDFICDNFDREVEFINKRCQEFLDVSIRSEPIIPDPLDLGDYIEISVHKSGDRKDTRVDISGWTDAQIYTKIEEIVELCAISVKKVPYTRRARKRNLRSQKDSVKMELAWTSLTPYMKQLQGLSLTEWRSKFKDWYKQMQPSQLLIKGVNLTLF